jgi:hypothetical protein
MGPENGYGLFLGSTSVLSVHLPGKKNTAKKKLRSVQKRRIFNCMFVFKSNAKYVKAAHSLRHHVLPEILVITI